jgi:LPS O-antigen subunit length determinant protein (WzzB/FepE family)
MWFEITFIIISSLQLLLLKVIYQRFRIVSDYVEEEIIEPISENIKNSLYS